MYSALRFPPRCHLKTCLSPQKETPIDLQSLLITVLCPARGNHKSTFCLCKFASSGRFIRMGSEPWKHQAKWTEIWSLPLCLPALLPSHLVLPWKGTEGRLLQHSFHGSRMVSCGPSSRYLTSSLTLHKFYFAQTLNCCIKVSIHLSTHSSTPLFQTHFFLVPNMSARP